MTALDLVLITSVTATAAGVQGSVGYGFGFVATPALALIDRALVPVPVLLAGLPMSLLMARRERLSLDVTGVRWAVVGRLPGTAVGAVAVVLLSGRSLTLLVAALILANVGLSVSRWRPLPTRRTMTTAGVVSGFMGTTTSIGGPPIALVYQRSGGPQLRATLAAYFVFASFFSLTGLALVGQMSLHAIGLSATLLPGILAGYWSSPFLARRLDQGNTQCAVLVAATVSAIALGLRELL